MFRLRPIGNGVFGSFMAKVAAENAKITVLKAFTRNSGMNWNQDILKADVDGVYVCTPDHLHKPHAISCLNSGKHVLVEKPVLDFKDVRNAAEKNGRAMMVGFHRRHDSQYKRARQYASSVRPKRVLLESYDPVPADADLGNVVRNSLIHDIDILGWMFDGSTIDVVKCEGNHETSAICVVLRVRNLDGHEFDAELKYAKLHATYVQRVVVDEETFGYEFAAPKDTVWPNEWHISGPGMAQVWKEAYATQFGAFLRMCRECDCDSFEGTTEPDFHSLYDGYQRTFSLMEEIAGRFDAKAMK